MATSAYAGAPLAQLSGSLMNLGAKGIEARAQRQANNLMVQAPSAKELSAYKAYQGELAQQRMWQREFTLNMQSFETAMTQSPWLALQKYGELASQYKILDTDSPEQVAYKMQRNQALGQNILMLDKLGNQFSRTPVIVNKTVDDNGDSSYRIEHAKNNSETDVSFMTIKDLYQHISPDNIGLARDVAKQIPRSQWRKFFHSKNIMVVEDKNGQPQLMSKTQAAKYQEELAGIQKLQSKMPYASPLERIQIQNDINQRRGDPQIDITEGDIQRNSQWLSVMKPQEYWRTRKTQADALLVEDRFSRLQDDKAYRASMQELYNRRELAARDMRLDQAYYEEALVNVDPATTLVGMGTSGESHLINFVSKDGFKEAANFASSLVSDVNKKISMVLDSKQQEDLWKKKQELQYITRYMDWYGKITDVSAGGVAVSHNLAKHFLAGYTGKIPAVAGELHQGLGERIFDTVFGAGDKTGQSLEASANARAFVGDYIVAFDDYVKASNPTEKDNATSRLAKMFNRLSDLSTSSERKVAKTKTEYEKAMSNHAATIQEMDRKIEQLKTLRSISDPPAPTKKFEYRTIREDGSGLTDGANANMVDPEIEARIRERYKNTGATEAQIQDAVERATKERHGG